MVHHIVRGNSGMLHRRRLDGPEHYSPRLKSPWHKPHPRPNRYRATEDCMNASILTAPLTRSTSPSERNSALGFHPPRQKITSSASTARPPLIWTLAISPTDSMDSTCELVMTLNSFVLAPPAPAPRRIVRQASVEPSDFPISITVSLAPEATSASRMIHPINPAPISTTDAPGFKPALIFSGIVKCPSNWSPDHDQYPGSAEKWVSSRWPPAACRNHGAFHLTKSPCWPRYRSMKQFPTMTEMPLCGK